MTEELSITSILLRGAVVLGLVAANGFFVAAEFSLVASRHTRIEAMVRRGDRKAKNVQRGLQSLDRYISGIQLGITLASLSLGWLGEPALASAFERLFRFLPSPIDVIATHGLAVAFAFAIITFLHIVLGELAPKALALLHPEQTSRWVAAPLILFTEATNPFIWILNGSANWLLRRFGARPPSEMDRVHSPEEIVMLARQSQKSGALAKSDVRMIEGVFEFTEKTARDVMTPRTDVIALPANLTLDEASDRIAVAGRSRYPVYGGSLDEILGMVHAKQVFALLKAEPTRVLSTIVREPLFVPGTAEVEDVLAEMKQRELQLAVVLDEFGGTAGIVTMEDMLEEIVGKIYDEYDWSQRSQASDGVWIAGSLSLTDANERYGFAIPDVDYHTIGGYVFGELGRLPVKGDRVPVKGGMLEVAEMRGKRVGRLQLIPEAKIATSE